MTDDIHTTLPGQIISWDGTRAVVKPTLAKKLANGQSLSAPQIVNVPVCFPIGAGGAAVISVPLKRGDPVMLNFAERALEDWLSGSDGAPSDPRRFDLSDCFATPVVRPMQGQADTENLSLVYNSGSLKIAPSGDMTINAPTLTINANISTNGTLTNNGKNISSTHTHGGVTPGGSNTGIPS